MGQVDKDYYLLNREKILQKAKERYAADPELRQRVKDTWKVWAKKNPDKLREAHRKYRHKYRENINQRARVKNYSKQPVKPRLPREPRQPRPPKEPKPPKTPTLPSKTNDTKPEKKEEVTTPIQVAPLKIRFDGPVTLDESAWF